MLVGGLLVPSALAVSAALVVRVPLVVPAVLLALAAGLLADFAVLAAGLGVLALAVVVLGARGLRVLARGAVVPAAALAVADGSALAVRSWALTGTSAGAAVAVPAAAWPLERGRSVSDGAVLRMPGSIPISSVSLASRSVTTGLAAWKALSAISR